MARKATKTRVRKPVSDMSSADSDEVEDDVVKDDVEDSAVETPVVKVVPQEIPRARVVLVASASLRRQGRTYKKDRPFLVQGEEAIAYFKADKRFHVSKA
jgi:hypothetical protein